MHAGYILLLAAKSRPQSADQLCAGNLTSVFGEQGADLRDDFLEQTGARSNLIPVDPVQFIQTDRTFLTPEGGGMVIQFDNNHTHRPRPPSQVGRSGVMDLTESDLPLRSPQFVRDPAISGGLVPEVIECPLEYSPPVCQIIKNRLPEGMQFFHADGMGGTWRDQPQFGQEVPQQVQFFHQGRMHLCQERAQRYSGLTYG